MQIDLKEDNLIISNTIEIKDNDSRLKLQKLVNDLKNFDNYLFLGSHIYNGNYETKYEYNNGIVTENENIGSTQSYNNAYVSKEYFNPRSLSFELVRDLLNFRYTERRIELIKLFLTSECRKKYYDINHDYNNAYIFLNNLIESDLSKKNKNFLINKTWPDFGYFSYQILDCLEFKTKSKEDIKDNNKDVQNLVENNTKILELAKKVNYLNK